MLKKNYFWFRLLDRVAMGISSTTGAGLSRLAFGAGAPFVSFCRFEDTVSLFGVTIVKCLLTAFLFAGSATSGVSSRSGSGFVARPRFAGTSDFETVRAPREVFSGTGSPSDSTASGFGAALFRPFFIGAGDSSTILSGFSAARTTRIFFAAAGESSSSAT